MTTTETISSPPPRRLFGTDGVRGIANTELSSQMAMAMGAAAAQILRPASGAACEVVVGRDPRISGDLLEAALVAGLCSQGIHAHLIGVIPTPGVAFVTRQRGAAAGVVISASHNPVQDNGIKFFGSDGKKLPDEIEARIEAAMQGWENLPRPSGGDVGRIIRDSHPDGYIAHLSATCTTRLNDLRLVIDCSNGAASYIADEVFAGLGAKPALISARPDGVNINDGCGSLHPERMASLVQGSGADGGLAFDGDADRVILSDEYGRIFDGDRILCMLGLHYAAQNQLTNNVVVGTVMSNLGLERALGEAGVRLIRAPVGDRYVMEQMAETGAVVGGEKSGHILLPNLSTTGDGLLTALQVLCICRGTGRSLGDWADEMQEFPQKLVSVKVREREGWDQIPAIAEALRRAEAELVGRGRIFVRPSGTEKVIRVMAEAPDSETVDRMVALVADALQQHLGL